MSIKAIFPAGVTELTVHGLHQWDYGREIEIHADNLPGMVEVHFACSGMDTAVVRSCALIDGKVTAAIPDRCLEQTTPIVAWVYALEGRTDEITDEVVHVKGETILTIKLPITPRTKPQPAPAAPEEVTDKYTEAVAAMAELYRRVGGEFENMLETLPDDIERYVLESLRGEFAGAQDLEEGRIIAGKAKSDEHGNNIAQTYVTKNQLNLKRHVRTCLFPEEPITTETDFKLEVLPEGKSIDHLVGITAEVKIVPKVGQWSASLYFTGNKSTSHTFDPDTGIFEVEFHLSAPQKTYKNIFYTNYMKLKLHHKNGDNGQLYMRIANCTYSQYYFAEGEENLYAALGNEDYEFKLVSVTYWFV